MSVMEYKQAVCLTSKTAWGSLSLSEKNTVLQTLENKIASEEGRYARNVVFEEIPDNYAGFYNHRDPTRLHLSYTVLDNADETLDTLYHEGRHAYQHDCIDNGTGFPEPILQQFRDGFANKVSPRQNIYAYRNNFTEKDAYDYAEKQCNLLAIERAAYLRQEQSSGIDGGAGLNTSSSHAPLETESVTPDHTSSVAVSRDLSIEQWERKTCSWQPEIAAVKVYGGSSTTNKVYTNLDVCKMVQDRLYEDQELVKANMSRLSPEQQQELDQHWHNERRCATALTENIGPGKNFDGCAEAFFTASDLVHSSCPYDLHQDPPDYSVKNDSVETEPSGVEESLDYSVNKPSESTDAQRKNAVDKAWIREAALVREGRGTRDWTVSQQAELLDYGKVTGFEGSHMMTVKDYPEYAGNPDNIQFLPSVAHFEGVHEGYPRGVTPNGRFDEYTGEVIPAEDDQIPEQPIVELSDKYDHSQKEYHQATPEMEQSGQRRHDDYYQSKQNHPEKSQKIGFRAEPEEADSESQSQHSTTDAAQDKSTEPTQERSNFWSNIPHSEEPSNDQSNEQSHSAQNSISR